MQANVIAFLLSISLFITLQLKRNRTLGKLERGGNH